MTPFRQRQVLEHRTVGVFGNDGADALVVADRPFVEAFIDFAAQAVVECGYGRVLDAAALKIGPENRTMAVAGAQLA
ncbi:MAG: hypothetical protein CO013_05980 [Syntrophobacterales bacterium CG_4_8_14_3_um_filter_58_8]|nr:MAG: hypothetical protein AUK26_10965 [Syntrophaceae bacterium CG2_30_58_14]PIV02194.1 MAG: hypothetical protein COS57_13125 [Syntrophobacterales bacterium CG03_land_8_20_14_0_80_58_14]PJC73820.1 MAG: hypothetical protein CO013_05980 [Syntrophobacterales bacterium CG_4_8_14_3_um_filter_58_8]